MSRHKKFPIWQKIVISLLVITFLAIGFSLFTVAKDPETAALFADNILRPLIGDQATIAIEGVLFGVQDQINKAKNSSPSNLNYTSNINKESIGSSYLIPLSINIPSNISPYVDTSSPLPEEGVWKSLGGTGLYSTFIRTDSTRPFAVVNLVYIPLKNISIGAVAGTKYPGGTLGKPGTGTVPSEIQRGGKLIAAFNGGFQEKDGHYGMYANGVTYVPMKNGLATLFIYKNGAVEIQKFDPSQMTGDVIVARQNGPLLITDGEDAKSTSKGIELWAGTSKGDYVTWRSGLGITKNGDLIYAVGPSLTPTSLADALRLAGSVNAMQLDINNFWVRFMVYSWDSQTNSYTWAPLTKSLPNSGQKYLNGNEKDFFYLYEK